MAHHRQRIKRYRNSLKNRTRNLANKSVIKTVLTKVEASGKDKKKEEAQKSLTELYSAIDKAVKYGVLHKKNAARKKSRASKALQTALSA